MNRIGGTWSNVRIEGSLNIDIECAITIDDDDIPQIIYTEGTAGAVNVVIGNQNDATSFTTF